MQAENLRPSGFIISPLSVIDHAPQKIKYKPIKEKRKPIIGPLVSQFMRDASVHFRFLTRIAVIRAVSALTALCALVGICNFFTVGTAIYCNNEAVAFAGNDTDFKNALSSAKAYAEEKNVSASQNFTTAVAIIPKSRIISGNLLRDKLLIASGNFASGCTLYFEGAPVFTAENEGIAREVVEKYISLYSMNGDAKLPGNITYKTAVLPSWQISDKTECRNLLGSSGEIPVISVASVSVEKEIPFETETQPDGNLYIGESVTVREGQEGVATLLEEVTYKNGAIESSRVLDEDITVKPVARVLKVGTKTKDVLKEGLFRPISGVVSSEFGKRWGREHEGIDFAVPVGTPVKSAECGTVSFCGDGGTYGKLVKIDHGNGVVTAYAHLSEIKVSVGQAIGLNTTIALSGNTGRSTGPHLHFEVVKNGVPLNPRNYIKKSY